MQIKKKEESVTLCFVGGLSLGLFTGINVHITAARFRYLRCSHDESATSLPRTHISVWPAGIFLGWLSLASAFYVFTVAMQITTTLVDGAAKHLMSVNYYDLISILDYFVLVSARKLRKFVASFFQIRIWDTGCRLYHDTFVGFLVQGDERAFATYILYIS